MFLAGVTFTFLLPVVNKIDMSTNFALGALQVFGPFFLAAGILMLAFSFFGPSREVTVKWINELQQYIDQNRAQNSSDTEDDDDDDYMDSNSASDIQKTLP